MRYLPHAWKCGTFQIFWNEGKISKFGLGRKKEKADLNLGIIASVQYGIFSPMSAL
jgi:hypothetical protein